jgi:hypothetical protein
MAVVITRVLCFCFSFFDVRFGFVSGAVSLLYLFVLGGKTIVFSDLLFCDGLSFSLVVLSS